MAIDPNELPRKTDLFGSSPITFYTRAPELNLTSVPLNGVQIASDTITEVKSYNPFSEQPVQQDSANNIRTFGATPPPEVATNKSLGSTTFQYTTMAKQAAWTMTPEEGRLETAGLPAGAQFMNATSADPITVTDPSQDLTENRVMISDQTGLFISSIPFFSPLKETGGVLFPYTPTIAISHRANYDVEAMVHTNYSTAYYVNSTVDNIGIQAQFTCQTPDEAAYVASMMHFFSTATKMFYGQGSNIGAPPPVLFLDGHGKAFLDHVPVVIKDFDVTFPNDMDYISTRDNSFGDVIPDTMIPVVLAVNINLIPVYSRQNISQNFGLEKFAKGSLMTTGTGSRKGGWI